MHYHDHADVLSGDPPLNRPIYAQRLKAQLERDTRRRYLASYRACVAAYRDMQCALLIRTAYPANLPAQSAYTAALDRYVETVRALPSWCVPPSYIAEGM